MENCNLSEFLRNKGKNFAQFMEELTVDEFQKTNEAEFHRVQEEHGRFKEAYDKGNCYLCHKPLKSFSKNTPCIHWLLKPKGFKKKDISSIASNYGIFQIQSLLRWYANEEAFAKNINNLSDEGTKSKLIELTIRYKNLEWSFSCAESDYFGHKNSQHTKHPHYHFQMRIDNRPFINFNDFHLPLSESDVVFIEATKTKPDLLSCGCAFGEGMEEMFTEDVIEEVLNSPTDKNTESEAQFKIDSFVCANEGKKIRGEDLHNIIQEAKEKNVSIASLLHKLPNTKTNIIVTPGTGVVEQSPRSRGKKNGIK